MRKKVLVMMSLCMTLFVSKASAQWTVVDPTNLAQGIVNSCREIVQTSTTAENMINNFKETVKIYEQGKKYYDALKSVNNLVRDARKVQQTIVMVGDITDIYVGSFQKMMHDENFSVEELSAIASGYTKLLEESTGVLNELRPRPCAEALRQRGSEVLVNQRLNRNDDRLIANHRHGQHPHHPAPVVR